MGQSVSTSSVRPKHADCRRWRCGKRGSGGKPSRCRCPLRASAGAARFTECAGRPQPAT